MAKKDCRAGRKWDHLVNDCVSSTVKTTSEPKPSTDLHPAVMVQQRPTTATVQANPMMMLSPALWIFVGLATVGSIVALVLWFVIYRQHTRNSSTSEDAEPGQEPLQKTEPPIKICPMPSERNCQAETLQRAAGNPAPCAHLHLGDQTSSKWEEGFTACRGPARHAGTEGVGGLLTCSTMREHRIPLPATELGGTALVTTKTM